MNTVTKITFLDHKGEKFFGEGPARLLQGIEETGSVRAAAMAMDMAYSKALRIMKHAESVLGFPLTARSAGGKAGGGSRLTPEGKAWLEKYEAYRSACVAANLEMLRKFFPRVGCVIMASGMSTRFGRNKLMEEFNGAPMILQALHVTEGLQQRVVVTRHADVAELCRKRQVAVVLHELPHRNDTIRLGLEALHGCDGCIFLPGDQPLLRRETLAELIRSWELQQEKIIRPVCEGVPGSPVLFPQWAFPELMSLPEGKGGNWVIHRHPEQVAAFSVSDPCELMDADTPETLQQLREKLLQHTKKG